MKRSRGRYMGNVEDSPIIKRYKSLGYSDVDIRIILDMDEMGTAEFMAMTKEDQRDYLNSKASDPRYSMTPEAYAAYIAGQRGQSAAMQAGEAARLKSIADARAASPEIAASITEFGAPTPYGAAKLDAAYADARPKGTGLLLIAALGVGAFLLMRRRRG